MHFLPVAFENGGVIENTYAISNVELSVAKAGEGQVTDCGVYTSAIDLIVAQGANITAVNGWSDCWAMETVTASDYATTGYAKNTLKFGETQIVSIVELSSGVESANFDKLIESDLSAYYVLTSDLDFNGKKPQPIGDYNTSNYFAGTFDGNGYTIKNYVVQYTTVVTNPAHQNGNYAFGQAAFMFGLSATGAVKNLSFEYTNTMWNSMSFIHDNSGGLIENIYLKANYTNANVVNENTCRIGGIVTQNNGKIKNCIAEVSFADTTIAAKAVGAIAWINQANGVVDNCYVVSDGTQSAFNANNTTGTATNYGVFATIASLVTAQSANITVANGWSSYWKVANGAVSFGR